MAKFTNHQPGQTTQARRFNMTRDSRMTNDDISGSSYRDLS
jgi:hypothetical protein